MIDMLIISPPKGGFMFNVPLVHVHAEKIAGTAFSER